MKGLELLESDALRSFSVFARHCNFTHAAAELGISQPALHVKINKLGRALGVRLYERVGRDLVLTTAGQSLADFAAEARTRSEEFLGQTAAPIHQLTIATGRGALLWLLDAPLAEMKAAGASVRIIVTDRLGCLSALNSLSADVAILGGEEPPARLLSKALGTYPMLLALSAEHRLASRHSVRVNDLEGLDLLTQPKGSPHRAGLEQACETAGVTPRFTAEISDWSIQLKLVSLGVAAAVVNGCARLPAGVVGIPITGLAKITYWAVTRPARTDVLRTYFQK